MKITKKQLVRLIREEAEVVLPESRKVRVTKSQLRRMLQEQAAGGLPSVDDLAKKLGAAGPEAAIDFVRRLLDKANFSAAAPEEPAAEIVEPETADAVTVEEEPIDPQKAQT